MKHERIRIFKNDLLELTTYIHPAIPMVMWTPVILVLIFRSFSHHQIGLLNFGFMAISGLLVWTLVEYALHRFAFHYVAEGKLSKRLVYIMHGLHHDDAMDPMRLVMPPVPALIYSALLFWIFRAVLGPALVEPFFAFFLVGYLAYDYLHYYVHHFNPKNKLARALKQHHMLHHFAKEGAKWGVSSPLWDYIFGTMEEKNVVKNNAKILR